MFSAARGAKLPGKRHLLYLWYFCSSPSAAASQVFCFVVLSFPTLLGLVRASPKICQCSLQADP